MAGYEPTIISVNMARMSIANLIIRNPVARALQILGDHSTIMIMRDVFLGRHRFTEFFEHSNLSKGTLTARLESLVANGVLHKALYSTKPPRYEYRLTEKGRALYPWALMIWQWESDWGNQLGAGLPSKLTHDNNDAHVLLPICLCRHCKEPVTAKNVSAQRLETESESSALNSTQLAGAVGKQRRLSGSKNGKKDNSLGHVSDVIGDRWSSLVIGSSLLGVKRYEDYQLELGIATNILASRLKSLTRLGVLDRVQYQAKPPRYEYFLSNKGRAFYGQTMALRQWVLDYFTPIESRLKLIHLNCGAELDVDVVCESCHEIPNPSDVNFDRQRQS